MPSGNRLIALGSTGVAIGVNIHVLYRFVDVTGGTGDFLTLVGVMGVLATVTAWRSSPRWAAIVGTALVGGGLIWYQTTLGEGTPIQALLTDAVWILSGNSLLAIGNVTEWAFAIAPGPVFLAWYLALRRRYDGAMAVTGVLTLVFVLSGDLSFLHALIVVASGTLAIVAGDFAALGREFADARWVSILLAVMLASAVVAASIPIGVGSSVAVGQRLTGSDSPAAAGGSTDAHYPIQGSIDLGTERKFTVVAQAPRYWRETAYGRYTGTGWVRTAGSRPLDSDPVPTNASGLLEQRVVVNATLDGVPAAWRPAHLTGLQDVRRGDDGSFVVREPLAPGATYTVRSAISAADQSAIGATERGTPRSVYTRLPESTAPRVDTAAARITRDASTTAETARAVEAWLERNKGYSLHVDRPTARVAERFLFDMEAGYCTYFATTMVVMLRTQGVPARFVTGYTPGVQVGEHRWAVLEQHSHAWVEVYLPDAGWTQFDPTPAGPRRAAERETHPDAYQPAVEVTSSGERVDQGEVPVSVFRGDSGVGDRNAPSSGERNGSSSPTGGDGSEGGVHDGETISPLNGTGPSLLDLRNGGGGPTRVTWLAIVGLGGVLAGYLLLVAWPSITLVGGLLWLILLRGRREPAAQIEAAFAVLEGHLASQGRPRERGETVRQWFSALEAPDAAMTALRIRERARYGNSVSPSASEAITALTASMVARRLLPSRRFLRGGRQ
jgi:transglutaminase-like putative cysteine protease